MDVSNFYPLSVNCWANNIVLNYNATSGLNYNQTGVESKIPDFGGVDAISYLDKAKTLGVWNETIIMLEQLGYVVGQDLFGAPYDWRLTPMNYFDVAPDHETQIVDSYYSQLKGLIELAYQKNGRGAVVLSLSMGGPVFALFLNHYVDQTWKSKYLSAYVSLDGAFGGSVSAIATLVSPSNWLTSLGSGALMQKVIGTMGSSAWMLPDPYVFGFNTSFVGNPSGNFSASSFSKVLAQANMSLSAVMWESIMNAGYLGYQSLGIPLHIIHGVNVPTPQYAYFNTTNMMNAPQFEEGNGDGTILVEGLTVF